MLLFCQHAGSSGETQLVLLFLQQPPLYMQKKWSHFFTLFIDEKMNATRNKHFQNIWALENLALTSIKLGVKMQLQAAYTTDCPWSASGPAQGGLCGAGSPRCTPASFVTSHTALTSALLCPKPHWGCDRRALAPPKGANEGTGTMYWFQGNMSKN